MAEDQRIATVLLKYNTDIAALRAADIQLSKTRGEIQFTAQMAKQVSLESTKAGASIRDAFGSKSSATLKTLTNAEETATQQMIRLKEAATGAQQEIKKLSSIKAADIVDPELGDILGGGGGIRAAQQGIRLAGSKLRALPSIQIPGAGNVGTDAIANVIRLIGSVPPPLLAVGAAFAVVGASVVALNVILGDSKSKLDAATVANTSYYDLIRNKTTSGELQANIKTLADKQAADLAELNSIRQAFASGFKDTANVIGNDGAKILFALGQVSDADDKLTARADELRKTTGEQSATLGTLISAQGSAAIVQNDLAAATLAATKAEDELATARANNAVKGDESRIAGQIQAANLAASGTEKQVQDLLDGYARQKEVLQANLPIIEAELAATKDGTDAHKAYQTELDSVHGRLADLDTSMLTLAGDTLATVKANDAAAKAEKQRADSIKLVEKFNTDVLKINADFEAKKVDLATKLADKETEIAAKAVEEAQSILDKLTQKLADLAVGAQREADKDIRKANFDGLQEQIKFQRDEVSETQKHLDDIARIRRQAQDSEFEQGLDRDFAGLAKSRRATAQQINESNIQFNQDRQARLDAFNAKRSDDAAQFAFEQQERILKFTQDIADARAQASREQIQANANRVKALAAAQVAYNKDLQLLNSKHVAELNARNAEIVAELNVIRQGTQAKLALEAQYWAQAQALVKGSVGSGGSSRGNTVSSGTSGLSGGLSFGAGLSAGIVSGRGNTSSTTTQGGLSLNMPINIQTGGSAAQVAAIIPAVRKEVDSALTLYHQQIYGTPR